VSGVAARPDLLLEADRLALLRCLLEERFGSVPARLLEAVPEVMPA
jgi:hypothetical protein